MIKNFVFDMGKILMDYESMRACKAYIEDEADQKEVCTALFVSPEWVQLDMGIISEEQALRQVCSRLPQRLHESARLCLENWDKKCMWQIEDMKPIETGGIWTLYLLECECASACKVEEPASGGRAF